MMKDKGSASTPLIFSRKTEENDELQTNEKHIRKKWQMKTMKIL